MNFSALEKEYRKRFIYVLEPMSKRLESYLNKVFIDFKRAERIYARAKSVESFIKKATNTVNGNQKI